MNEGDLKCNFFYDKEERLGEYDDVSIKSFITRLEDKDLISKYEMKIKRIDMENSGLQEKIKEALQEE